MRAYRVADLFCGAGGSSSGVQQACDILGRKLQLTAVNHWARAVESHAANHPTAAHFCQDLTTLDPVKAVPGGKLDLLVASPECLFHSSARGGTPSWTLAQRRWKAGACAAFATALFLIAGIAFTKL